MVAHSRPVHQVRVQSSDLEVRSTGLWDDGRKCRSICVEGAGEVALRAWSGTSSLVCRHEEISRIRVGAVLADVGG